VSLALGAFIPTRSVSCPEHGPERLGRSLLRSLPVLCAGLRDAWGGGRREVSGWPWDRPNRNRERRRLSAEAMPSSPLRKVEAFELREVRPTSGLSGHGCSSALPLGTSKGGEAPISILETEASPPVKTEQTQYRRNAISSASTKGLAYDTHGCSRSARREYNSSARALLPNSR
jgi:hypothetical protein